MDSEQLFNLYTRFSPFSSSQNQFLLTSFRLPQPIFQRGTNTREFLNDTKREAKRLNGFISSDNTGQRKRQLSPFTSETYKKLRCICKFIMKAKLSDYESGLKLARLKR